MKGVLRARARPDATCREGGRSDAAPPSFYRGAFLSGTRRGRQSPLLTVVFGKNRSQFFEIG